MENLTAVDGVVRGHHRAVGGRSSPIRAASCARLMAILGWVGAAIAAYSSPQVEPLVKELPVVGEFLADSCELSIIAAFAGGLRHRPDRGVAVHAAVLVGAVQRSALGGIDQALGFLFGAARGVLLIAIAFIVYDRVCRRQASRWSTTRARPRSSPTSRPTSTRTSPRRAGLDRRALQRADQCLRPRRCPRPRDPPPATAKPPETAPARRDHRPGARAPQGRFGA
jgi:uncharacterized membrane protein required for colicin V production